MSYLAQWLVLGLLDSDQRRIAQLIDARLNRKHGGKRHFEMLKKSSFELALETNTAVALFNTHDDGRMWPSQDLGQQDSGLRVTVVIGLETGENQIELLSFDRSSNCLCGIQ